MVIKKKKICAGCNEEKFIYKNIDGKKYCMSCAYKLQPPKSINKRSEKQLFKMTLKKQLIEEDKLFYLQVWKERTWEDDAPGWLPPVYPKCENCKCSLGSEPNMMFFHHILEKRNFPELRHISENIAILCPECHNKYETNPDTVPYLKTKREELMRSHLIDQILKRTPNF